MPAKPARLTPAQQHLLDQLKRLSGWDRRWVMVEDAALVGTPATRGNLGARQTALKLVAKGHAELYPEPVYGPGGGTRTILRPLDKPGC